MDTESTSNIWLLEATHYTHSNTFHALKRGEGYLKYHLTPVAADLLLQNR